MISPGDQIERSPIPDTAEVRCRATDMWSTYSNNMVVPLRQCTDILKKYQCNIIIAPSSLGIYLLIPHTNTIYLTDTALRFRIISFMVRETFLAITLRYITNINIIILRLMTTNLNRNIGWGQMFSLSGKLLKIAKTNSMIMP